MKKLFLLSLLALSVSSAYAADVAPVATLYIDMTAVPVLTMVPLDEPLMCTMEYAPVCGADGVTYGNACSAGKNKIAYKGECNTYVDNVLYAKLESTKTETLKRQLSKYSDAKLLAVLETIDQKIEMVKLSRIVREMQVEKITLYTFVKNTIPSVLESRTVPKTGKRPGLENIAYTIDGTSVLLKNGVSETANAPGSASKTVTRFFGNTALGDLNGDGTDDAAFILTQDSGGSGIFYYVAAATMHEDGYHGTDAVFLGDRIAPQTTEIKDGQIIVNYADRKTGEAMTFAPSVGISRYFKVSGTTLAELKK